jgi:hypothetical protein
LTRKSDARTNLDLMKKLGLGFCISLILVGLFQVPQPALFGLKNSAALTLPAPAKIVLSLQARPPVLPADGGTYGALVLEFVNETSGMPYIPQTNETIFLSSSNNQTGTVPQSINFPAGSSFVVVQFTTTTLAGSTVVTALCQGFPSASQTVTTEIVGGIPTALNVYMSPSQLPPNAKLSGNVVVQVVDSFGNPIKLASSLVVTLSSSNSQYGNVPPTLTIPAHSSFAVTSFTPTYLAGQTTITASAPGLATGQAIMTTTGPIARRLVLSAAPNKILANSTETTTLSIQLQDNNSQTPVIAQSGVEVVVTSNNTNVLVVPNPIVTIPAGSSYVSLTLNATNIPGVANITASAQGYLKGSVIISTIRAAGSPSQLGLSFAPNTLLPNNSTYPGAVVVELLDTNGNPAQAGGSGVTVYARSSNNASMFVSTSAQVIRPGRTHVLINISSTYLPGSSEITVQASGFGSATSGLVSFGETANKVSLEFAPNTLLSDGGTYNAIIVSLINSQTGTPAIAPVATHVSLATSVSSLGQVQSSVTILPGQSYAIASFTTLGIPGSTVITASASNLTSTNATLSLVTPPATKIGVFAIPSTVVATGNSYQNIIVQLEDSSGNPEKTDVPIPVQLSAQNLTVGSVSQTVTIEPGNTTADAFLNTTLSPGSLNITAFANGFSSGQTFVRTILIPMKVQVLSASSGILAGAKTNLTVIAQAQGTPLAGATVVWEASFGTLTNTVNKTDSSGIATAVYQAGPVQGGFLLKVVVAKPGYSSGIGNVSIVVSRQGGGVVTKTATNSSIWNTEFWIIPLWVLLPIIVAAPIGSFFFIRRRAMGSDEDGESGGSDGGDGDEGDTFGSEDE